MRLSPLVLLLICATLLPIACGTTQKKTSESAQENSIDDASFDDDTDLKISDPWEGFNRKIFAFNDFFFRYFLKPVATGWNFIAPKFIRQGIDNFFQWAYTPARLVNNLLQIKIKKAGQETLAFTINATMGGAGFYNAAKDIFSIEPTPEDTDQTLGAWGLPEGPYVVWPFIGSNTIRSTFGFAGDVMLQPQTVLVPLYAKNNIFLIGSLVTVATYTTRVVNRVSLDTNEYDDLVKDAIDPYSFIRDIYLQNTRKNIAD